MRNNGLMEFAGVDKAARSKMGGVENAGVDISARYGKGGHCRSGQCGTIVARVDNAGGKKRVQVSLTETVYTVHPRKIEVTKQTQISKY